jgi:hypothetical protein
LWEGTEENDSIYVVDPSHLVGLEKQDITGDFNSLGAYVGIYEVGLKRNNRRTWRWLVQDSRAGIGCCKYALALFMPNQIGHLELT